MRRIFFVATFILLLCRVAMAEEIKNYTLDISKVNQEASNLHVKCSFSLDFQDFGGGQEFSLDNLNINSGEFEYELYLESKSIVFRKVSSQKIFVNMNGCMKDLLTLYTANFSNMLQVIIQHTV